MHNAPQKKPITPAELVGLFHVSASDDRLDMATRQLAARQAVLARWVDQTVRLQGKIIKHLKELDQSVASFIEIAQPAIEGQAAPVAEPPQDEPPAQQPAPEALPPAKPARRAAPAQAPAQVDVPVADEAEEDIIAQIQRETAADLDEMARGGAEAPAQAPPALPPVRKGAAKQRKQAAQVQNGARS